MQLNRNMLAKWKSVLISTFWANGRLSVRRDIASAKPDPYHYLIAILSVALPKDSFVEFNQFPGLSLVNYGHSILKAAARYEGYNLGMSSPVQHVLIIEGANAKPILLCNRCMAVQVLI